MAIVSVFNTQAINLRTGLFTFVLPLYGEIVYLQHHMANINK